MATHRKRNTLEYSVWARIKTSCYNKNNPSYKTYGARGIRMQEEWINSFDAFFKDMGKAPIGCTGIELIDYNSDFCRINCRWTSRDKRRPLAEMPNQKNRTKYKKYSKPKRITITLEQEYFEFIQRQAIEKSRIKKTPVSASDLIKEILIENAPMPKQGKLNF